MSGPEQPVEVTPDKFNDTAEILAQLDLAPEDSGELGVLMEAVDTSRKHVEHDLEQAVKIVNGPSFIRDTFTGHAVVLQNVLLKVLSDDSGYTNEERGTFVALLLTEDDRRRVGFLQNLVGKSDEIRFRNHYEKIGFGEMAAEVTSTLNTPEEGDISINELAEDLVLNHFGLMGVDANSLFQSSYARKLYKDTQIMNAKKEKKEQMLERIKTVATLSAATAIGGLISNTIYHRMIRRR